MSDSAKHKAENRKRPSMGWLLSVFALLFALQVLLYNQSFDIKPAGDDFAAPLSEIWRGQTDGVWSFFKESTQRQNYRPLQSLGMYVFGNISEHHREFWIRILHITGMAVFASAAVMWFRAAPLGRVGALVGAIMLFVHPVLVAPIASIDGFATLWSTGLMWWAVYAIFALRSRPWLAVPLSLAIFIVAMGWKEYALGAVPLACLTMLMFRGKDNRPWTLTIMTAACFSLVVLGIIFVRKHTIPPPELEYLTLAPLTWLKNASLFGGVLLFMGSSTWVFINKEPMVYAIVGSSVLVAAITVVVGLVARWRDSIREIATPNALSVVPWSHGIRSSDVGWWILFLLLAAAAASFPAVLVFHVSEMYAAGMLVPLTILIGLAADGFVRMHLPWRIAGTVVLVAAVVSACFAVRAKVNDIRDSGLEAARQAQQILELLPEDARDLKIGVYYPPVFGERSPQYSVFVIRKEVLIRRYNALDWYRPNRNLRLEFPLQLGPLKTKPNLYAIIVRWDPKEESFKLVPWD